LVAADRRLLVIAREDRRVDCGAEGDEVHESHCCD
jgi:hypothetical protein